jgi:hypothetical protein
MKAFVLKYVALYNEISSNVQNLHYITIRKIDVYFSLWLPEL